MFTRNAVVEGGSDACWVRVEQAEAMGEGSGPPAGDGIDEDLQARLNNLRKS